MSVPALSCDDGFGQSRSSSFSAWLRLIVHPQ
jgi:hypothetical protein